MKPWTASEEDVALAIMRRGGDLDEIAEALPHRTGRALGIKARRLSRVIATESRAAAARGDVLTAAEVVAEFTRLRAGRTDWVTEAVLGEIATNLGISLPRLRDTMLRHWGVIE